MNVHYFGVEYMEGAKNLQALTVFQQCVSCFRLANITKITNVLIKLNKYTLNITICVPWLNNAPRSTSLIAVFFFSYPPRRCVSGEVTWVFDVVIINGKLCSARIRIMESNRFVEFYS